MSKRRPFSGQESRLARCRLSAVLLTCFLYRQPAGSASSKSDRRRAGNKALLCLPEAGIPAEPDCPHFVMRSWSTIVSINRRVNKAVHPMTDMDHWHVADQWNLAEDGFGDCEDYQLLKRHLLAEAGLPRRAMRMTVVVDANGEGHAVLTLLTDRGDLVLDNKTNDILPWHRTGYVFVKRESQDAIAWVSLGGVTSPVTTANR
ncbi:transglutaminase-like cysteine peptidase [Citrobacter sp. VF227]